MACEIINKSDLREIYTSGQGRLNIRGRLKVETKNGKDTIIIYAMPPGRWDESWKIFRRFGNA